MSAKMAPLSNEPLDEPPPYTLRPDTFQGEETLDFGLSGPFQPAQAPPSQPSFHSRPSASPRPLASHQRPQPYLQTAQAAAFSLPQLTKDPHEPSGKAGSLWQRLSDQIEQITTQAEKQAAGPSSRFYPLNSSSSSPYPGQPAESRSAYNFPFVTTPTQQRVHQPQHCPPSSTSSLPPKGSDFSRDFYAAGTGQDFVSASGSNPRPQPQHDHSPSTTPVPGRPLLYEGQLLVFPHNNICEKCRNTGYKYYNPMLPCKKCWSKYGIPFSGPIVYLYSSPESISNAHLQRPLPHHILPAPVPPSLPPRFDPSANFQDKHHALGPGTPTHHPRTGATYLRPGDPRLGGSLCWRCNGKGTMSIIIDTIDCPICDGAGRTF